MKKINLLLFVFVISNLFLSCATTIETVKNDSPFILKDDEGFILLRILNPNVGKVIDEFYYSNGETAKKQPPLHPSVLFEYKNHCYAERHNHRHPRA